MGGGGWGGGGGGRGGGGGGEGEGCWQKYIWQIINTVNLPANKYLTGGESAPQGEIRQAGMSSQPINE